MAKLAITDAKVWLDKYAIASDLKKIALQYGAELLDATAFGNAARTRLAGYKSCGLSGEGHLQLGATSIDNILFTNLGVLDVPVTVAAEGGDDGELGFSFLAAVGDLSIMGAAGEVAPVSFEAGGLGALVRGTILHNATRTATGNGTGRNLGAVSATQKLYAALHVITVSGTTPTLDVIVQSDGADDWLSPTTRITFGQKTAAASQWATPVAGAITDTWWRITYTIGGASPSFLFIINVAIQ